MRNLLLRGLLSAIFLASVPVISSADVNIGISVGTPPPPLPYYDQPPLPGSGYLWMPGYWAWSPDVNDYFWVPGTWVEPPEPEYLWTPGYWGWNSSFYSWHPGYWGPQVGFYGGVNYGYGYTGRGYDGGYWRDRRFYYNRSVTNVRNVNVTNINVYNKTVVNERTVTRVSYNGGHGGIDARPTGRDQEVEHQRHTGATPQQTAHERTAVNDRELRASVNRGKPAIAATERPAQFSGKGVVKARAPGGPVDDAPRSAAPSPGGLTRHLPNETLPRAADDRGPNDHPNDQERRPADMRRSNPNSNSNPNAEPNDVSRPDVNPNRPPQGQRPVEESAQVNAQREQARRERQEKMNRTPVNPPDERPQSKSIPPERRAPQHEERAPDPRESRELRPERREPAAPERPDRAQQSRGQEPRAQERPQKPKVPEKGPRQDEPPQS